MFSTRIPAAAIALSLSAMVATEAKAEAEACMPDSFQSTQPKSAEELEVVVPRILQPDEIKLSFAVQFDGPCARLVRAMRFASTYQLTDGRLFGLGGSAPFGLIDNAGTFPKDDYDPRTEPERLKPMIDGVSPMYSMRVNSRRVGGDFLGLWHVRDKWLVQSFSLLDDRTFTAPRPLLESAIPLRSVTYFPSPDAPCGRVDVVQEQTDHRVAGLAFFWCHQSSFAPR